MRAHLSPLNALFGGALQGSKPLRYVYVDEAGTSAKEPVSVVASVIVHPDTQWMAANNEICSLLDRYVPPELRPGFVFHAKDVFGGGKHRAIWGQENRWRLLNEMAALPKKLRIPIACGLVRRGLYPKGFYDFMASKPRSLSVSDVDHMMAFMLCAAQADKYLRHNTGKDEVATLVAENVTHMRSTLKRVLMMLSQSPIKIHPEHLRHDVSDLTEDKCLTGEVLTISKIVDGAHFAEKPDAPLLQLADVCAFSVRRWISLETKGENLMESLLGQLPKIEDFSGPSSSGSWHFLG